MTLISEDLFLLLMDDESGKPQIGQLHLALGGAVLVELALEEAVLVDGPGSFLRPAKVGVVPGAAPEDAVLRDALAVVAEKERTAQDLVKRLGKGLDQTLGDRLAARGMVDRRDDRVLGLVRRTTWPARDPSHEEAVRRELTYVLVQGAQPTARIGALAALLHAVDRAHKTVPHEGMSSREVKRRAKEISQGDWAAKAVRDAVAAATAATVAAVTAATSAAVASSSSGG